MPYAAQPQQQVVDNRQIQNENDVGNREAIGPAPAHGVPQAADQIYHYMCEGAPVRGAPFDIPHLALTNISDPLPATPLAQPTVGFSESVRGVSALMSSMILGGRTDPLYTAVYLCRLDKTMDAVALYKETLGCHDMV